MLLRKRPANLDPIGFLAAIIIMGLIFLIPVYAWEILTGEAIRLTRTSILSILYVAIFPSILSYIFWNRSVEIVGANKAGIFIHLMPVFTVILSFFFLEERLLTYHIPGIGLIFFGIFLVTTGKIGGQIPTTRRRVETSSKNEI